VSDVGCYVSVGGNNDDFPCCFGGQALDDIVRFLAEAGIENENFSFPVSSFIDPVALAAVENYRDLMFFPLFVFFEAGDERLSSRLQTFVRSGGDCRIAGSNCNRLL
jgi:hypothetical protein